MEVQPAGCSAGSNVSELGLSKILMSFQGGHSWDPLTAGLLFQMWRLQSCPPMHGAGVLLGLHGHNSICTLPMVPIGQEVTAPVGFWWPKDGVRGKLKGCSCRNIGPISTAKLPYLDNFVLVNSIRPSLCLVTIWLLTLLFRDYSLPHPFYPDLVPEPQKQVPADTVGGKATVRKGAALVGLKVS